MLSYPDLTAQREKCAKSDLMLVDYYSSETFAHMADRIQICQLSKTLAFPGNVQHDLGVHYVSSSEIVINENRSECCYYHAELSTEG